MQEGWEFKIILGYLASLSLAEAIAKPVLKEKMDRRVF